MLLNVNDTIKLIVSTRKDKQKPIIIEELAELIQAILHYERGKIEKKDLISEVADVEIVLAQLKILYEIDQKDIDDEIQFKLDRTLKKINI